MGTRIPDVNYIIMKGKNTMSKKNKNGNTKEKKQDYLQEAAIAFGRYDDSKKFAKKERVDYDGKKERNELFYAYLMQFFPETVEYLVRYGHIRNDKIKEIKDRADAHLASSMFIEKLTKSVKKGEDIENIKLFPILLHDYIVTTLRYNKEGKESGDASFVEKSTDDLSKLVKIIMKKKFKKYAKAGVDENLAFDLISSIPTCDVLAFNQKHYLSTFFRYIYEHAKTKTIDFETVVNLVFKREYYPLVITFALLERKEKYATLNDSQKALYLKISDWAFNTMENEMDVDEVERIIKAYISGRKRDDEAGKDAARRYTLSSLSEQDYSKIVKVVNRIKASNPNIEKYL